MSSSARTVDTDDTHSERTARRRSLRFSLKGQAVDVQLAFWQDISPNAYRVLPPRVGNLPLDARMSVRIVDRLLATRFRSKPYIVSRPSELLQQAPSTFVKVRRYIDGGAQYFDAAHTMRMVPDHLYIIDHSRPWTINYLDHETCNIFVPHWLIGYDPSLHAACTEVSRDTLAGRALHDAMAAFEKELPRLSDRDGDEPILCELFTSALRTFFRLEGDAVTTVEAVEHKIQLKALVDRHIDHPELDFEFLQRRIGASRATIYRNFSDVGGLNNFIRKRRLEKAFDELALGLPTRGIVRQVSERWHFSSVGNFSNAFLERFGKRPSDVIGLVNLEAGETSVPSENALPPELLQARHWLRQIFERFTTQ